MDIATILGIVSAFGLVLSALAMGPGGVLTFFDAPSVLIVFGGTIGIILINFPLGTVLGTVKVVKHAFFSKTADPILIIKQMVDFSAKARKEGILTLEAEVANIHDPFFAKGIRLAVDGHEISEIETILGLDIDYLKERHSGGADIMMAVGTFAPAMGLIGTLIGLVQMLKSMDDPSAIGPAMAVALLTTFYGAVLANMIALPMAGKLKGRSKDEVLIRDLQLTGIMAISSGNNPRVVEEKLFSFLAPNMRISTAGPGGQKE